MTTTGIVAVEGFWTGYTKRAGSPQGAQMSLREAICKDAKGLIIPRDRGALDRSIKIPGAPYQFFRAIPRPGGFSVELGSNLPYARHQARRIRGRVDGRHVTIAIHKHIHQQ